MAEKKSAPKSVKKTTKTTAKAATKAVKPVAKATVKTAAKPKAGAKVAILAINNMQYVASEGETIPVRVALASNDTNIDVKLLALIDGENFNYGKPYLENKISFDLGEIVLADKVKTSKFKAKARYRRTVGHRAKYVNFTLNSVK